MSEIERFDHTVVLPMHVAGSWAVDGDGTATNGGGMAGCVLAELTITEATATYARVHDEGTSTFAPLATCSSLTGWAANYQLTADAASEQVDDFCAFGAAIPFAEVAFELGGALATYGGNAGKWQYHNGTAFADLTNFYDHTDVTAPATGLRPFQQAGSLMLVPPADWAVASVGGQLGYWIRWIVTALQVTQTPVKTKEHEIVTPADAAWVAPFAGVITSVTLRDGASTLHTTADVKFVLMNFTTGANSGVQTFAQDIRHKIFNITDIAIAAGDSLGVVVTQEDTAAEVTDAVLELTITRS